MDHGRDIKDIKSRMSNLTTVSGLPKQVGSVDCGVFICAISELIYHNVDPTRLIQENVLEFQINLQNTIINHKTAPTSDEIINLTLSDIDSDNYASPSYFFERNNLQSNSNSSDKGMNSMSTSGSSKYSSSSNKLPSKVTN